MLDISTTRHIAARTTVPALVYKCLLVADKGGLGMGRGREEGQGVSIGRVGWGWTEGWVGSYGRGVRSRGKWLW